MTKHYQKILTLESLQDSGTNILYEVDEIGQALHDSIRNETALCFFLVDLDIELCVSTVKEIVHAPKGKDQRESEVVLEDNRVIKLYEVMAVCHYHPENN